MDFQEKTNSKALQDSNKVQIERTKSLIEEANRIIANKKADIKESGERRGILSLKSLERQRDELEEELRIILGNDNTCHS